MSTAATRPSWPPTWAQFWGAHDRRAFTPTFNTFLDSLIQDPKADLLLRVVAWVLRASWGNWSDSCVTGEGVIATQVDCARDLKLTDRQGQPDRRKVNPIFKILQQQNCIRFEGQEIVVIDNPLGLTFALPSPEVGKGGDILSPLGFTEWLDSEWKDREPARFREYQEAEERYKQLRTQALTDYQKYKAQMSARGPTIEEQCREGVRQNVGEGADNSSERVPTNGGASLYQPLKPLKPVCTPPFSSFEESDEESAARQTLPENGNDGGYWPDFFWLAKKAGMRCTPAEVDRRRQQFEELPFPEQIEAQRGIQARLASGEYDPGDEARARYTPSLKNYLLDQLWTAPPRASGAKKGPDTSWLENEMAKANGVSNAG